MKKIMWAIACLSLIGTAVAISFLPDQIPVHYDIAGNVNRVGSKYECLIFPVLIIVMAMFTTIQIGKFEKKAEGASDEKEAAAAGTNARVIGIVGILTTVVFTGIEGVLLYNALRSGTDPQDRFFHLGKVILILVGALFILLGGLMTKSRRNSSFGIRTRWSLYNDNTWEKSNRFGAFAMMIAGLLVILAAIFMQNVTLIGLVILGAAFLMTIATVWYSRKVYLQETGKEDASR